MKTKRFLILHATNADAHHARVCTVCDDPEIQLYHVPVELMRDALSGLQYSGFTEMPGVRLTNEQRALVLSRMRWVP